MKTLFLFLTSLFLSFSLNSQITGDLRFGTDSTLDIVTWNIENFPKNGSTTVTDVSLIINAIHADIFALQEIKNDTSFNQVLANTGYNGYMTSESWHDLAFIYNPNSIKNVSFILLPDNYVYTSIPMLVRFTYAGQNYALIDVHLKASESKDDGIIDFSNTSDDENRRFISCNLIQAYINQNLSTQKVFVAGDMNDALTDEMNTHNVFQNLINDSLNYKFADMSIAEGPSSNWSWPAKYSYPDSHFDHILITNEMFTDFAKNSSTVKTIKIDSCFSGGLDAYRTYVSDHRPVGIRLRPDNGTNINTVSSTNVLSVYPNPAKDNVTFNLQAIKDNSVIEIYNSNGQKISTLNISSDQNQAEWNAENMPSGIYFARLISKNITTETKIIITK